MDAILNNKTTVERINVGLIIVLVLVVIFFVIAQLKNQTFLSQSYSYQRNANFSIQPVLSLKSLKEYTQVVSSRELFRPFVLQSRENVQVTTIDDITRDMMLVGVVSVGEKEAIIKNRRTRQTYFVTEGSQLGELRVLGIFDDKIEVGYKNERKDLYFR